MRRPFLLPCAALALLALPLAAQDYLVMGKMWTFENPPLAYLEEEYGFAPDQEWLNSMRLAALRLGERDNPWCSASFVSPKGLIMTNHHCVRDKIAEMQGQSDYVASGYTASSMEDELQLPGLTVQQLVSQEDVTDRVEAGIEDGDDAAVVASKRQANIDAIVAEAEEAHPDRMFQVVPLFQGAIHQLYGYVVYDDIRLVCAPHLQTAHFGGDPDNFTYPRYSIDFSFCRAYVNGEPADTAGHYFKWSQAGPQQGQLVFVPGNPGSTDRLLTVAQLEAKRDAEYPIIVQQLDHGLRILNGFADQNPMIEKSLRTTILSWENSFKALSGMLSGLRDDEIMQQKEAAEARFREAVAGDEALAAKYGDLWDRLAELAAEREELQPKLAFHTPSYSTVIGRGVAIADAVDPTLDEERRAEARQAALEMELGGNMITRSLLIDHFVRAVDWLPDDDPYLQAVLGDMSPPQAVVRLGSSRLAEQDHVEGLLEGGADAVAESEDIGIVVGRVLAPLMRANQAKEEELESRAELLGTRMGRALHAVYGTDVSPDATMTLRFSDGLVRGYPYNGTVAPWRTSFYGLYGRNAVFANEEPFHLPEIWLQARDRIDLDKGVNFVSTNDIIGGNSGSAVVDRDLQVVGLIFDGNIESLPNDFLFRQVRPRSVSVHVHAIIEAMTVVYDAQRVVDELMGNGQ